MSDRLRASRESERPIRDALRYPLRGSRRAVTLLIGGLTLAPTIAALNGVPYTVGSYLSEHLLLPSFNPFAPEEFLFSLILVLLSTPMWGYLVVVVRQTSNGNMEPPSFGLQQLKPMAIDGVRAAFLYFTLFTFGANVLASLGEGIVDEFILFTTNAVYGSLAPLILGSIMIFYAYPGLIAVNANSRELGVNFDLRSIRTVLFTRTYALGVFRAYMTVVVVGLVSAAVAVLIVIPALVLSWIGVPVVLLQICSTVIGLALGFYGFVCMHYAIGRAWAGVQETKPKATLPEQLERLRRLRDQGILSEREHSQKYSEIVATHYEMSATPSSQRSGTEEDPDNSQSVGVEADTIERSASDSRTERHHPGLPSRGDATHHPDTENRITGGSMRAMVEELHARGLLTDTEYEQKLSHIETIAGESDT